MFTAWQLDPAPAPMPASAEERSPILVQLLEEAERDRNEEQQENAQRPAPQTGRQPRPFAHD